MLIKDTQIGTWSHTQTRVKKSEHVSLVALKVHNESQEGPQLNLLSDWIYKYTEMKMIQNPSIEFWHL